MMLNRIAAHAAIGALALLGSATANDLAVTVYNSNIGVVTEARELAVEAGTGRLSVTNLPSSLDAASVRFAVTGGVPVTILEQNFAYDLVSPNRMYQRFIEQPIELVGSEGQFYQGTLLSSSGNMITLRLDDGTIQILQVDKVAEVNFPALPDGLITRPTLFWNYEAERSGTTEGRLSYQTRDLTWKAEYVAVLSDDESALELAGWAAVTNASGRSYENATLRLVAGDIHRATDRRGMIAPDMMMSARAETMQEEAFFEYHLYTVPRPATLADNEMKQLALFEPSSTDVTKSYRYEPDRNESSVVVSLAFINSDADGLGMPLPAGRVRTFQATDDGTLILLGEDNIRHTPRDEEVALTIGTAFDITAKQVMTNQSRISQRSEEQNWEFTLNNRKDEAVEVELLKRFGGDWTILNASQEYNQEDARTAKLVVPIDARSTTTVTLTVRIVYR